MTQQSPASNGSVVPVEVVTATPFSEYKKQKLKQSLSNMLTQPVVLDIKLQHGMTGNISISIGGIVIDGSLQKALKSLKEEVESRVAIPVEVATAIPLDSDEQQKLRKRLSGMVDWPLLVKYKVDANLIGGMVIRIGDTVIDGSLRSKLSSFREELLQQGKSSSVMVKRQSSDRPGDSHGIEVITAVPLSGAEKVKFNKRLAELMGHPVRFREKVEPEVIGGMVIKVGDKEIDSSLRKELSREIGELIRGEAKKK